MLFTELTTARARSHFFPFLFLPEDYSKKQDKSPDLSKQAEAGSEKRRKILIVEDEVLVAENLSDFLEQAGYSVVALLSSGEEAIRVMATRIVDLILMDIRLSGDLNGIETVKKIHASKSQVPIIFLTAYVADLFRELDNISPSLYRYISKPYDQKELERVMRELIT